MRNRIISRVATRIVFNHKVLLALSWFAAPVAPAWTGRFAPFTANQGRLPALQCVLHFWQSCAYVTDEEEAGGIRQWR